MMWRLAALLVVTATCAHAALSNVARGKTVTQSSIWSVTNPSSFAVDGNPESSFRTGGHCAKSGMQVGAFFMVDLGDSYEIKSFGLAVRKKDGTFADNADVDFEIRIGNSPYHLNNPVCYKYSGKVPESSKNDCGSALCGRYVSIQRATTGFSYMHLCEIEAFTEDTAGGCVSADEYSGVCRCSGDPHCQSFDGKWLHFQGACMYTLARDNCGKGVPKGDAGWEVIANFNRRGSDVSYVREVYVHLYEDDMTIAMLQDFKVLVNGKKMKGSPKTYDDKVTITITPNSVYLMVEGGIRVRWDGESIATVEVQEAMKGDLCGICGNFDGNDKNDWTVGNTELCMEKYADTVEAGDITEDYNVMGTSWTAAIDKDEDSCSDECPVIPVPPVTECPDDPKAKEHCDVLHNKDGPFAKCIEAVPKEMIDAFFENCAFDSCELKDYENVICEHATALAEVCQAMVEVTVSWRSSDLCPPTCGKNMEYKACGEACVPTCSDLKAEKCGNVGPCSAGCFCKDGFVYNNAGECIEEKKCGCEVPDEGIFIQVGESFTTDDCSKHCTCEEEGGDLVCKTKKCATNEVCRLEDGEYGCSCQPPFVSIADECVALPNPCVTADASSDLQCLVCKNAKTKAECEKKGVMTVCSGKDPICAIEIVRNMDMEVKKFERTCSVRADCDETSIGSPNDEKCVDNSGKVICKHCGYGALPLSDENGVYQCVDAPTPTTEAPVDICTLKKDAGKGSAKEKRFYFDLKKCKCKPLTYGGSGGNANNFKSMKDCEDACAVFETPADCLLDKDPGPCDKFKKWYFFDVKKNKCKKFNYGGCDGNANLFKKKLDCRTKCKRC